MEELLIVIFPVFVRDKRRRMDSEMFQTGIQGPPKYCPIRASRRDVKPMVQPNQVCSIPRTHFLPTFKDAVPWISLLTSLLFAETQSTFQHMRLSITRLNSECNPFLFNAPITLCYYASCELEFYLLL